MMARKPQPRKVKKDQLEKDQDEIPADEDKKEADNDESPASPPPIQRKTLTGTDVGSDDEREDLEDKSQQEPKKGQDDGSDADQTTETEKDERDSVDGKDGNESDVDAQRFANGAQIGNRGVRFVTFHLAEPPDGPPQGLGQISDGHAARFAKILFGLS